MKTSTIRGKKYVSERQRIYYETIVPKLDRQILSLDLGMRVNTCLVNSGIFFIHDLKRALEEDRHIEMLDKYEKEDIRWKMQIKGIC